MASLSSSIDQLEHTEAFAREVANGLSQERKFVPSRYLYDALGSQLFEAICELPWYKITRSEQLLLEENAGDILRGLGSTPTLIELGVGCGDKLSTLLKSRCQVAEPVSVHLVDISPTALALSSRMLDVHEAVEIATHLATYQDGLKASFDQISRVGRAMVMFLGSNVGNMGKTEADEFLRDVWRVCRPGDRLLLGADLVKPARELLKAYNDPLGVTAAFNKNLLVRLNRELDADFDLQTFDHRVVWNSEAGRVESYLVSRIEQLVCLREIDCCIRFSEGESIWTENSYKYEAEEIVDMGRKTGFSLCEQWIDPGAPFALTLFEA